jgi:hypothetical protein
MAQLLGEAGLDKDCARFAGVLVGHKHTARQKAERALHGAHVLISDEEIDAGAAKDCFNPRNQHKIVGAKQFDQIGPSDQSALGR